MRHRTLTREEKALWAHVQRTATPFPGRTLEELAIDAPRPARATIAPATHHRPAAPAYPSAPPPLVAMDRRTLRRVKRGARDIEGAIDLHGLTQAAAHEALRGFLNRKQREGASLVMVVTGKGAGGPDHHGGERGVLRRMVPHWLRLPDLRPLILGFETAAPHHGGEGALYVRLRRARGVYP